MAPSPSVLPTHRRFGSCHQCWHNGSVAVRVFLLDDHELVREGIRSLLESDEDIEVVGEAATGPEALTRVPLAKPDVAILDVRLEDGDGIEVCRELRSAMPDLVCLMLTSFADDEAMYASVMAGAAGYVLKQIKARDLIEDVKKVATGVSLMDPRAVARVVERIANPPKADPSFSSLSPQEARILDLIADGKTNKQIAEAMFLSENTVKNYITACCASSRSRVGPRPLSTPPSSRTRIRRHRVVRPPSRDFEINTPADQLELEALPLDPRVHEVRRGHVDAPLGGQTDERPVVGDLGGQGPF